MIVGTLLFDYKMIAGAKHHNHRVRQLSLPVQVSVPVHPTNNHFPTDHHLRLKIPFAPYAAKIGEYQNLPI
jgi:predicted transcriptional regulator